MQGCSVSRIFSVSGQTLNKEDRFFDEASNSDVCREGIWWIGDMAPLILNLGIRGR
jgi:hypothetical protein